MHPQIHTILKTREFLCNMLKDVSPEALNQIPAGFNNNIIWNIGHLTAAAQSICYLRSGLQPALSDKYVAPFRNGTRPEVFYNEEVINDIMEVFLTSMELLNEDYNKGMFANYSAWTPRYGVEINDIDSAFTFLFYHEGMHTGYIMAQKKLVH